MIHSLSTTESVLELTKRLVAINSVFPHEQAITDFIESFLLQLGYEVQRVPVTTDRDNLVAVFGQAEQYLCLYGHMDTVEPDPLSRHDLFQVRTDDKNAYGLGVVDMKGGLAVILKAAVFAVEHQIPLKLAFGVDEENISQGSYVLSQQPFFQDVDCMIVAESGQVFNEDQDFALNYGRKGRIVIEALVKGQTAHAARSDEAINAITEAGRLLMHLTTLQFPAHKHLGKVEIVPFYMSARTSAFSIPDQAILHLNILTVPDVTSLSIISKFESLAKRLKISATFKLAPRETPYMEAYEVDRSQKVVKNLEKIFAHYHVQPGYTISVADENRFAHQLQIPVISLGPIGSGDHTHKEWVSLRSLAKTLEVYEEVIRSRRYTKQ